MSEFFKTSTLWGIDFRYDGRPRRWFQTLAPGPEVHEQVAQQLHDLYGRRAKLETVRLPTDEEERRYLRGEEPKNVMCPTGRHD
jgi:hypothetical protein